MAVWAIRDRLTWPEGLRPTGIGCNGWTWQPPDSTGLFSPAGRCARRDRVNSPLSVMRTTEADAVSQRLLDIEPVSIRGFHPMCWILTPSSFNTPLRCKARDGRGAEGPAEAVQAEPWPTRSPSTPSFRRKARPANTRARSRCPRLGASAPVTTPVRDRTKRCTIAPCRRIASRRLSKPAERWPYAGYPSLMVYRWSLSSWSRRSRARRRTPFVVRPTASTSRQSRLCPRTIGRQSGDRPRYACVGLVGSRRVAAPARCRGANRTGRGDWHGVSAISCWEIAKLVEHDRLALPLPVEEWLTTALSYPGIELVPITPRIAVESTQLPGDFHNDPSDQLIVATARVLNCVLLTADHKIRRYTHVATYAIT
jgi:PIN domain nuclease of toxin-antitoxin system